ncbi:MAG: hypothetical protein ACKVOA_09405 [Methylophilaceae bacterium]
MGRKTLIRLGYDLLRWARHLTWQWMAFFLLLAGSIGFYVGAVMPLRHALAETTQHALNLQQNAAGMQEASVAAARQAPAGQIETFDAYFPTENSAPDTLETMMQDALKVGLVPKQAEYRVLKTNPGNVLSYQLTLPIKGTYPQLVEFISTILPKVNNVSLDNIAFQRQKIGDAQTDSILMFTLYLRREH